MSNFFNAEEARELIEQKSEFKKYQKVKEDISNEIKRGIEKGHTYRLRGEGTSIEKMALKVAAALEMGYEVKNVKVKEGYCYAEFHWDEEPTATVCVAGDNRCWATIGAISLT